MSLHKLQRAVHVAKDKKNDFGGYNYRTAEGILAAIKAQLPEGASIIVTDSLQEVAGQIFVTSTARLSFADGATAEAVGHAMHPLTKKGMDPSQITGAASSYARKYALSGLMALDDGSVDPDAAKDPYEEDVPEFDSAAERDRIMAEIAKAHTLPDLAKLWKGEAGTLKKLQEPHQLELTKIKDARKASLSPPDPAMQAPAQEMPGAFVDG